MKIPINIRNVSIGKRLPGGDDYVRVSGESLSGDILFEFEVSRLALAETLAFQPDSNATSATLTVFDAQPEPQSQEPQPSTRSVEV